jgi:hypothetical protein
VDAEAPAVYRKPGIQCRTASLADSAFFGHRPDTAAPPADGVSEAVGKMLM